MDGDVINSNYETNLIIELVKSLNKGNSSTIYERVNVTIKQYEQLKKAGVLE